MKRYLSLRWINWSLALFGIAIFLMVSHEFSELREGGQRFFHVDQELLQFLAAYRTPGLTSVFTFFSFLGSGAWLSVLAIATLMLFTRKKDLAAMTQIILGAIGGDLIQFGLKLIFRRDRPSLVEPLVQVTGYSYPSGHSVGAAAVYFTLALILSERLQSEKKRIVLFFATFILVSSVALSRLYLGVHYPSDVLGGFAMGGAWAFLVAALIEENRRLRSFKEPL